MRRDPPLVDLEVLKRQLRQAGIEEAFGTIVDTFLDSSPQRVADLRHCLASESAAEVARAAHALKSSTAVIGAGALTALLSRIEEDGRADALKGRDALADEVGRAADAVYAELRAVRSGGS
jgi:two-component system, sensor histidine kinase and response regulator